LETFSPKTQGAFLFGKDSGDFTFRPAVKSPKPLTLQEDSKDFTFGPAVKSPEPPTLQKPATLDVEVISSKSLPHALVAPASPELEYADHFKTHHIEDAAPYASSIEVISSDSSFESFDPGPGPGGDGNNSDGSTPPSPTPFRRGGSLLARSQAESSLEGPPSTHQSD
jgi:hypothetical protein